MLVVDLDTEVAMNGMVNFIGNSTGLYASQTVEALERIGCAEDASVLRQILAAAEAAGMTHAAIQADLSNLSERSVACFSEVHGEKWRATAAAVQALGRRLDFSRIGHQAEQYVAEHDALFRKVLGAPGRRTTA